MKNESNEVPGAILHGIRGLSTIRRVQFDSEPSYIPEEDAWALRLRLSGTATSDLVPSTTSWVLLIDPSYPAGRIRFYPSLKGGLTHTFPHQDRNIPPTQKHAFWRRGKPCLDSPSLLLGRIAGGPEPLNDAECRLQWHVERCIAWLEVAARDTLMMRGEPFELPQCPRGHLYTSFTIVHDEGQDTWPVWSKRIRTWGEVRWGILPGARNTIVAEEFLEPHGQLIRACRQRASSAGEPWIGYWWLWPSPVILPPWYSPDTWSDLRRIGQQCKMDVDGFLHWMAKRCGGKSAVVIMVGYPIPTRWREEPVEVHWQAILPPEVPVQMTPLHGFRPNERGWFDRLRRDIFGGSKPLSYVRTENWHPDRLQARGRLPQAVREHAIAVIGVGALGSFVAELLVRGGVREVLLIDGDDLQAGNLVRHTLTVHELGRNKADAVAERLAAVSPMSHVRAHGARLPAGQQLRDLLEPFRIVVDCTGDDGLLQELACVWWPVPRLFLSASTGFAAQRLFIFAAHSCAFPVEDFQAQVTPWLEEDRKNWTETGETLEGAGCWSPLFPARSDDVWLAAITTIKILEHAIAEELNAGLHVFEQSAGLSTGFHHLHDEVGP